MFDDMSSYGSEAQSSEYRWYDWFLFPFTPMGAELVSDGASRMVKHLRKAASKKLRQLADSVEQSGLTSTIRTEGSRVVQMTTDAFRDGGCVRNTAINLAVAIGAASTKVWEEVKTPLATTLDVVAKGETGISLNDLTPRESWTKAFFAAVRRGIRKSGRKYQDLLDLLFIKDSEDKWGRTASHFTDDDSNAPNSLELLQMADVHAGHYRQPMENPITTQILGPLEGSERQPPDQKVVRLCASSDRLGSRPIGQQQTVALTDLSAYLINYAFCRPRNRALVRALVAKGNAYLEKYKMPQEMANHYLFMAVAEAFVPGPAEMLFWEHVTGRGSTERIMATNGGYSDPYCVGGKGWFELMVTGQILVYLRWRYARWVRPPGVLESN